MVRKRGTFLAIGVCTSDCRSPRVGSRSRPSLCTSVSRSGSLVNVDTNTKPRCSIGKGTRKRLKKRVRLCREGYVYSLNVIILWVSWLLWIPTLAYSRWLERHIWTIPAASGGWTLAIVGVMVEIQGSALGVIKGKFELAFSLFSLRDGGIQSVLGSKERAL